ncbi:MAG: hypothetical protein NTX80_00380 [Candidatus Saccharibacteria bacterium]|nr:hypothetical protein [Candidatus Saccharibacteria bacterium]
MKRLGKNIHNLATFFIILSFIGLGVYTYKTHIDNIAGSTILKKRKADYDGFVTFYEDIVTRCGWVNGGVAIWSGPSTNATTKRILKKDVAKYLSDAATRQICVY